MADEPSYKALASELRAAIIAGEYPAHSPLPTEVRLAEARGLSRQTVRFAFAQLVAEGLVYRVRGRGSFAQPYAGGAHLRSLGSIDDLLALALDTELELVEPFDLRVDAQIAMRLALDSEEVMQGRFVRLHAGDVFSVTDASLPPDVGVRLLERQLLPAVGRRSRQTVIGAVEQTLGTPIAGASQSVTAVPAPADAAALIGCAPGDPVLQFDRLYHDRDGRLIELSITHANPARYTYRLELRRTGD